MSDAWWTALFAWMFAAITLGAVLGLWADRRARDLRGPVAGRRTPRQARRDEGVSVVAGGVVRGTDAIAALTIDVAASPGFPALQCATDRLMVRRVEVVNLWSGWSRTTSAPADVREGGGDHGD